MLLPEAASPILTRELLYTAVTRAEQKVTLVGTEDAVRAAVARPVQRASGLRAALWGVTTAGRRVAPVRLRGTMGAMGPSPARWFASPVRWVGSAAPAGLPGVRDLVRAGMGQVFGPPPFDPAADDGDPGLLGAEAASWRVIGEPAAIVGGIRALLVQLLHPLAMAGVADHSRFRTDPLGRLHHTSAYVTTTAFGSTTQALDAARAVRRVHTVVRGSAPDGRPYRADDPHLLAWVSLALVSSFLAADRAYAPHPVDRATADAFVAEQARAAALLDPRVDLDALAGDPAALAALRTGALPLPLLTEEVLPLTVAALTARLEAFRPELGLDHQGREALRFLSWPPLSPPIRAAYLPMFAGALATLEPWQRRLLGLPGARLAAWPVQANTCALLAAFRLSTGVSPAIEAARRRGAGAPAAPAA